MNSRNLQEDAREVVKDPDAKKRIEHLYNYVWKQALQGRSEFDQRLAAEKLKAVIAALQDKKIQIRTEVHSEQLDKLRNQLRKTSGRCRTRTRCLRQILLPVQPMS